MPLDLVHERLAAQELEAEIIEKVEGALWTMETLERNRVDAVPTLARVEVAVDPTRSDAPVDEAGPVRAEQDAVGADLDVAGPGAVQGGDRGDGDGRAPLAALVERVVGREPARRERPAGDLAL